MCQNLYVSTCVQSEIARLPVGSISIEIAAEKIDGVRLSGLELIQRVTKSTVANQFEVLSIATDASTIS